MPKCFGARAHRILASFAILAVLAGSHAVKAVEPSAAEQAQTLSLLPQEVRPYYQGYWYATKVTSDPLRNWHPHNGPWQVCHNDSYLGNVWRADLVAELRLLTKQLADQGLAKPNLIVTNSNGDINLELSQLKAEVAQGCDIIMSYPGSATGLCSGIHDAFAKGVLFVSIDAPVDCPEGINVATNPYYRGKFEGDWILQQIGGRGNIIAMNGQPGTSNTIAQRLGLADAVKQAPNAKVIGDLYGMWTGSVAKSEMLKFLATHPQPVAAVWSTGQMAVASGQALQQSGRPLPVLTDVTNTCSLLAYWKQHDLKAITFVQDGGPMAYSAFLAAVRIMAGQKPKLNTIFMPLPIITSKNLGDYEKPSMNVQSSCFANGPDLHLVPDSYFDAFFTGTQKVPHISVVATQ